MSVSELSPSTQNYLKAVWSLSEWSDDPVTPSLLAEKTGLRLSSVSDAVRRLSAQGLLSHTPYGAVTLTEVGRGYAVAMVRRHRLIESFLVLALGYGWDQVHDEAEALEHAVSDFMVDRMDEFLGFPSRDPHGDPIPLPDGSLPSLDAEPLSFEHVGALVTVERISDNDPALLSFFEDHGILLGARLEIAAGVPFSDSVEARAEGADAGSGAGVQLGRVPMAALYVSRV